MQIILKPNPEIKAKWGILAHVSEEERQRILALPFGQFKPAIRALEKQLKEEKKSPTPQWMREVVKPPQTS